MWLSIGLFVHYYVFPVQSMTNCSVHIRLSTLQKQSKSIGGKKVENDCPLSTHLFFDLRCFSSKNPHFSFGILAASWLSRKDNLLLTLSSNEVCSCRQGDSGGQKGMFLCSELARRARGGRGEADRLDPSTLFILAPR